MSELKGKCREEYQGDRGERFMSLYMAIQRRLYGYVISMIPDETVVDDIVQDSVSVMWNRFDEFKPGTDFAAWAIAIAKNRIFVYIKQKRKQKRNFSPQTIEAIQRTVETKSDDEDYRLDALRNCVKKLDSQDRQLLILRYEVDATLKGVSQRVGQSLNTIYNRLYRIRIMLMTCVKKTLRQEVI